MKNSKLFTKFFIGTIFVIAILGGIILLNYEQQKKAADDNIFSEIYNEIYSTYLGYNPFRKLDDTSVSNKKIYDKDMNETGKLNTEVAYKPDTLPVGYSDVRILFNFYGNEKGVYINFEWKPNSNITIWYLCRYSQKNNTFTKEIVILEEPRKAGEYINGEVKIKDYLKQYSISKVDLEKHYDEIVTQKILKDWCSIYDSKFSPKSYGKVTIKTQWEDW